MHAIFHWVSLPRIPRYNNGGNEVDLGNASAGDGRFAISTKNAGGAKSREAMMPTNLIRTAHESLEKMKVKQLDIFYIHVPDRNMTLDEWMPSLQRLYEEGVFRRFGISNFTPDEVKELHDYCKQNGYVLPSVYQGNYNAVARKAETILFPILRELKMSFYAYSPLAGGFLAKSRQQITEGVGNGRWAKDPFSMMYQKL